jgi:hypothetical protein
MYYSYMNLSSNLSKESSFRIDGSYCRYLVVGMGFISFLVGLLH